MSYLSNGEESAKRDHGNEFRGSKNGGREVWGGLKLPEKLKFFGDPRWPPPPLGRPDPGESGGGWPRKLTGGIVWMSPSSCSVRVAGGWPVVPPLVQTPTARKWSNDLTWCSRFWRVVPRVLELKRVFWG